MGPLAQKSSSVNWSMVWRDWIDTTRGQESGRRPLEGAPRSGVGGNRSTVPPAEGFMASSALLAAGDRHQTAMNRAVLDAYVNTPADSMRFQDTYGQKHDKRLKLRSSRRFCPRSNRRGIGEGKGSGFGR